MFVWRFQHRYTCPERRCRRRLTIGFWRRDHLNHAVLFDNAASFHLLVPASGGHPVAAGGVEDVERREQCGRAVPDVIVGHRPSREAGRERSSA
jgi:hypothetical protein